MLRGRLQQAVRATQPSGMQPVARAPQPIRPQTAYRENTRAEQQRHAASVVNGGHGSVTTIPYDGVPLTIDDMRRMVRESLSREGSPAIRKLVEEIVAQVRPKDYVSEVAAIYYWCLKNVRYLRDPVHVEYVTHPMMTLQPQPFDRAAGRRARQEDCETVSATIAAMCMSIGVPCEFVTVSMNRGMGFHHVFCVAKVKGVKLVLDPVPGPDVQEMLKRTVRHQVWPIEPLRVEGQMGWDVATGPSFEGMGRPF